jgi:hypothetical protein
MKAYRGSEGIAPSILNPELDDESEKIAKESGRRQY